MRAGSRSEIQRGERGAIGAEAEHWSFVEKAFIEESNKKENDSKVLEHLDLIARLPWWKTSESSLDLTAARAQLDSDHYGMEAVKTRILEALALAKAKGKKGAVLCFDGPPGTGKTTLAMSIAKALNREFAKISLNGVTDVTVLRGHRRTYQGALPGRIIETFSNLTTKDPVLLLDEVEKAGDGRDGRGSPQDVLLEVIDPGQNKAFVDHYLQLPFDLSQVLFICTSNDLSKLSGPLRDRMEIIHIPAYTPKEKLEIGKRHILRRALKENALAPTDVTISDDAWRTMIKDYAPEAGNRILTQNVEKIVRKHGLERELDPVKKGTPTVVDADNVVDHLGAPFSRDKAESNLPAGVVHGLAASDLGGSVFFFEAAKMPGTGKLKVTGNLKLLTKESAQAAVSYVRAHAAEIGVDPKAFAKQDIHIHVPGSNEKDGPSAGITMFTAVASAFSGRKLRPLTAMTGEASLRGRVLAVGGVAQKTIGAYNAGIKRLILPRSTQDQLAAVPREIRDAMEIIFVDNMHEVLDAALDPAE